MIEFLLQENKPSLSDLLANLIFYVREQEEQKSLFQQIVDTIKLLKNEIEKQVAVNQQMNQDSICLKKEHKRLSEEVLNLKAKLLQTDQEPILRNAVIVGMLFSSEEATHNAEEIKNRARVILKYVDPTIDLNTVQISVLAKKENAPLSLIFDTIEQKNHFMKMFRMIQSVDGRKCGLSNEESIAIIDEMTLEQRKLYKNATTLRNYGFKYIWTKGGKIFARKEEGAEIIRIKTETDIEMIKLNEL